MTRCTALFPPGATCGCARAAPIRCFAPVPCQRPMTIRDLFMHTSGLTYDFMRATNIDAAYRELQVGLPQRGYTLQDMIDQLARTAAGVFPGRALELFGGDRCAGLPGRGDQRAEPARVSARQRFSSLWAWWTPVSRLRRRSSARFASCYERNLQKGDGAAG